MGPAYDDFAPASIYETTHKAMEAFKNYSWPLEKGLEDAPEGLVEGLGYWQAANGYTAMILHDIWTKSLTDYGWLADYTSKVEKQKPNYINTYNDDSAWWAIAILELHGISDVPAAQLSIARTIWTHISQFVVPPGKYIVGVNDMRGAVMWTDRANETQINAITTSLYAELSARLAGLEADLEIREKYTSAAIGSLSWVFIHRYDREKFVVLDHIDISTGGHVDWTFTYTTGQTIAAAAAIYTSRRASSWSQCPKEISDLLDLACEIARRAMSRPGWVNDEQILTESNAYPGVGENKKTACENDDAVGFKSVLIRSLAKLFVTLKKFDLDGELQSEIRDFIMKQYLSITGRDDGGGGHYGPWWAGPLDTVTAHSQMAVLDVMAVVHVVLD